MNLKFIIDISETINTMKSGLYILGYLACIHTATFLCYFTYKYYIDNVVIELDIDNDHDNDHDNENDHDHDNDHVNDHDNENDNENEKYIIQMVSLESEIPIETIETENQIEMIETENQTETVKMVETVETENQTDIIEKDSLYYLLADKRDELDKFIMQLNNMQYNINNIREKLEELTKK